MSVIAGQVIAAYRKLDAKQGELIETMRKLAPVCEQARQELREIDRKLVEACKRS